MKTVKSLIVLSLILTTSVGFSQQDEGIKDEGRELAMIDNIEQVEMMVDDLTQEIPLTKEQEGKIYSLQSEYFKLVKQKSAGKTKPQKSEMESLRMAFERLIKEELTRKQIGKYEAFLKKRKTKHKRIY